MRFRQPVTEAGFIDAAWWPYSRDLTAELPAVLALLWTSGREMSRLSYNLDSWDATPRRMTIDGHSIRLGGFRTSDPLVVRFSDNEGRDRIDVLVIAPDTAPDVADRAMALAAVTDNVTKGSEILAAALDPHTAPGQS